MSIEVGEVQNVLELLVRPNLISPLCLTKASVIAMIEATASFGCNFPQCLVVLPS